MVTPWMPTHQSLGEHHPFHPRAVKAPSSPFRSGSGNPGREEVKLASNRGCKAASHAHCAGWHQEIKLPRHGLQQRSTQDQEGGGVGQAGNRQQDKNRE